MYIYIYVFHKPTSNLWVPVSYIYSETGDELGYNSI